MNVLFIGLPNQATEWLRMIHQDFIAQLNGRFAVKVYDFARPAAEQFNDIDIVVESGGSFNNREMIDAGAIRGVKLWQVIGTGMDHVDVAYFAGKGIPLANIPGRCSGAALAEHALFMILFFAKNYHESQKSLRARRLCNPVNSELTGKVLGLIGFGASARELAGRAAHLGMRIMAIDIAPPPRETLTQLGVESCGGTEDLARVVGEADYISIHTPLNETTRHLIGREAFALMKPSAVLINVARSEIVEETALIEALRTGRIKGAGLDVFPAEPVDPDHPLLRMDNVLATPHVAGVTNGTSVRRGQVAAENVVRVAQGQPPLHLVLPMQPVKN